MNDIEKEIIEILNLINENGLKNSVLRSEYEKEVENLKYKKEALENTNTDIEIIAKIMHEERRKLCFKYRTETPHLFRMYLNEVSFEKYGDIIGPDYNKLKNTKSAEEITESALRPNKDVDKWQIEGFKKWLENNYKNEYLKAMEAILKKTD